MVSLGLGAEQVSREQGCARRAFHFTLDPIVFKGFWLAEDIEACRICCRSDMLDVFDVAYTTYSGYLEGISVLYEFSSNSVIS
jgi:hypothetical protein